MAAELDAAAYPASEVGVVGRSTRSVARIGLALEAWPALGAWVRAESLDALFLHRPWALERADVPHDVPVLFAHLPFDERLTTGFNPRLAAALGMRDLAPIGDRSGRPLGMIGDVGPAPTRVVAERLRAELGGLDGIDGGMHETVDRIAVVGAMTDALVREAAARGAQLYVSGQRRVPAAQAVRDTGMAVAITGHARVERWGLATLAGMLRGRWPSLHVVLAP